MTICRLTPMVTLGARSQNTPPHASTFGLARAIAVAARKPREKESERMTHVEQRTCQSAGPNPAVARSFHVPSCANGWHTRIRSPWSEPAAHEHPDDDC